MQQVTSQVIQHPPLVVRYRNRLHQQVDRNPQMPNLKNLKISCKTVSRLTMLKYSKR